ncbi:MULTISPECIES: HD domain-containing protein [Emticicia]|uniref:HD domain-containing protein n=1 Tax=Emticicia TaxID=312278 RepID=UPI0007D8C836|nr:MULTISPECIES: HD domain-containing protein [Emticicia]
MNMTNKRKIFNDPVYGFVSVPSDLIFDLIEHPFFQRLRRIKQLGMAEFVYPGALHTRFHHALGAMHLMGEALQVLQAKGHFLLDVEIEAAQIAILLHDIGHGPFSHVLEYTILNDVHHEHISALLMEKLNERFHGQLDLAIEMFNGTYHREFFHQLISSQLDMDRMDYLNRDCFFTGVAEGTIGVDRIIKMLNVVDNQLVVEEKGLLSVENFLNARRLMYWQVYLHKTSICTEAMLIQIIRRARELIKIGNDLFVTPSFELFLKEEISLESFQEEEKYLKAFTEIDDYDIWACIKTWQHSKDPILSTICKDLLNRNLYKVKISNFPIEDSFIQNIKQTLVEKGIPEADLSYFITQGDVSNKGYVSGDETINILTKNKNVVDIADASDLPTIKALSNIVKKYYVCWGKNVSL